jgi:hypothetical protein
MALSGGGCKDAEKAADAAKEASDALTNATDIVDKGANNIQEDQGQYAQIIQDTISQLKGVADKLPKDVQSTLSTEVTQLSDRSVAKAGVEFHSSVDFLAQRAVQGLQRLKAALTGKPLPPSEPAFDTVSPEQLMLSLAPERRTSVLLYGWDMDHADAKGNLCGIVLQTDDGRTIPLPEARIGRTTHYQLTLNTSGTDFESLLTQNHVSKMVVSWNGQTSGLPQVLVAQKPAPTAHTEVRTVRDVGGGEFPPFVPPHTRGDADFDTGDNNKPMDIRVIGQTMIQGNRVIARVYMWAYEPRPNFTTAQGWSAWKSIYQADAGWQITHVSPIGQTDHQQMVTRGTEDATGRVVAAEPDGEPVSRFEFYGDHDGDEAGTWTRVVVSFRSLTVDLSRTTVQ